MDAPTQNQRNLQKLLEAMDSTSMTHAEFVKSFQLVMDAINKLKATNQTEFALMKGAIDTLSAKVKADAQDDTKEIRATVQSEMKKMAAKIEQQVLEMDAKIDAVEDGKDGESPDPADIVPLVIAAMPEDVEETGDEIITKINDAELLISKNSVEGLAALEKVVNEGGKGAGRPGWGAHPLVIQQSGTVKDKVTRVLNFTGATVTRNAQGVTTVAITGGSGGSGYQAALSGGLTGTNTWATAPSVLVIDGVPRQKVQTDGTVMWTGTTTTVLTNAPLPNFDIFASA